MIKKLSTGLLLPSELEDAIKQYIHVVEESTLHEPFITRITDLLGLDLEVLHDALTAMQKDKLVNAVSQADSRRDDLFIGFCKLIKAHERLHSPAIEAAYEVIWPEIYKAGTDLHALSYEAQTEKMDELLKVMDNPSKQMALGALNALSLYDEMKESQEKFSKIYNNKLKVEARKNYPTLREAKSKAIPHVNALLNAVDILEETGEESIEDLVMSLNHITDQMMEKVRERTNRQ